VGEVKGTIQADVEAIALAIKRLARSIALKRYEQPRLSLPQHYSRCFRETKVVGKHF
jgi:hypothetical protein